MLDRVKPGKLPADFAVMSDAEKLQVLLGASLAQAYEVCSWKVDTLNTARLNCWNIVRHDLWNIAFKLGLEDRRSAERERALRALVRDLPRRLRPEGFDDDQKQNLINRSQVDHGNTTNGGGADRPGSAS